MKKVLFIDRDGTILREPADEQVDSFSKFGFLPGAITYLGKIAAELEYELVMVTNQDGLGTDSYPEETFWPCQNMMMDILRNEGVIFSEVFIDRTFPSDNAPTRKPGTAMLTKYLSRGIDMEDSWVIGDRETDVQLASNLGCKSILIAEKKSENATVTVQGWNEIYSLLSKLPRTASVSRKTSETSVDVKINLDGKGRSNIKTGLGFFDHMLEQISRHGLFDVEIIVSGDLHVDEHHTIEDVGLALGSAFNEALGMKKGIQRYAFVLPMDECLAQVAVDLGGRPWLEWNAEFSREKIGEMPTEMFRHFFRSFSDTAKCTLNISASGENEHHRIEAIFKAFSKCLGQAAGKTGNFSIPSSKGTL